MAGDTIIKPTYALSKIYDVIEVMMKHFYHIIMFPLVQKIALEAILFGLYFVKFQVWNLLRGEYHLIEMNEMILHQVWNTKLMHDLLYLKQNVEIKSQTCFNKKKKSAN